MATNKKYLSKEGLTHLVELIKNGTAAKDHTHDFSDLSGGIAHELSGEVIEQKLVNGNGSVGELTVYGNTRQNLWVNPSGTKNGVTVTSNDDGSLTLSGTAIGAPWITTGYIYALKPHTSYYFHSDTVPTNSLNFVVRFAANDNSHIASYAIKSYSSFVSPSSFDHVEFVVSSGAGETVSGTYRIMLNEGSESEPWCPPGLNGVEELSVVCAGQNLWTNPSGTVNGVTVTANADGSLTVSGTSTGSAYLSTPASYILRPGMQYTLSVSPAPVSGLRFQVLEQNANGERIYRSLDATHLSRTFNANSDTVSCFMRVEVASSGTAVSGTYRIMLELGSIPTDYEPPQVTTTPIDLDGHALNSLPDGTRDELRIDGTGAVTLVQRVGVATAPTDAGSWAWQQTNTRAYFTLPANSTNGSVWDQRDLIRCDKLPVAESNSDTTYTLIIAQTACAENPAITSTTTAATVAGGATYLYPLATPKEVELPGVSMPSVNADSITVFAASNVPTELDATIIDLPVVPISSGGTGATTASGARTGLDVYSKAEVDAKVGDAIDLPLAVSKGGTGAVTAKAAQYNLLNNIGETAAASAYDTTKFAFKTDEASSANGVLRTITGLKVWTYIADKIRSTFGFSSSNVLPISHGGTGATTEKAAQNALLGNMNELTTDSSDTSEFVMCYTDPTNSNGAVFKRKASYVWNWIKTKADAVYLPKAGGTVSGKLTLSGGSDYIGNDYYIAYPGGGSFNTQTTSLTGFLKIILPVSWNSTMLKFKVSIFNYVQNSGADFFISGYNYSADSFWTKCTAYSIGDGAIANLPVVFGHDGTKCVIAIGSATTKWSYPQVSVSDVTIGYSGGTYSAWKNGWEVSFDATAIPNVSITISNPLVGQGTYAAASHDHSAANITSGTLPISRGGTGMTANPAMLVNLASASTANVFGSAPRPGVTGTLPVSHGGTGATAKGTTLLSNIGITISSSEAPATGTPGTIHIQLLD